MKCGVCKKINDELNGFGECPKCAGTFMEKLRKGDPPLFPEVRKKKKKFGKKTVALDETPDDIDSEEKLEFASKP